MEIWDVFFKNKFKVLIRDEKVGLQRVRLKFVLHYSFSGQPPKVHDVTSKLYHIDTQWC